MKIDIIFRLQRKYKQKSWIWKKVVLLEELQQSWMEEKKGVIGKKI
jgi:hypothetical protein